MIPTCANGATGRFIFGSRAAGMQRLDAAAVAWLAGATAGKVVKLLRGLETYVAGQAERHPRARLRCS